MLVEYNFETKDEDMVPRAVELRKRVAARKLTRAVELGAVGEFELKRMTEQNGRIAEELAHENFSIAMAGVAEKITVARAEQQLKVQDSIRRLDVDLNRVGKLSKSRLDALTDLERRINDMRAQLREPKQVTVEEEMGKDLRVSYRAVTDKQFTDCTRCGRRILKVLFNAHDHACALSKGSLGDGKRNHESKPPVFDVNQDLTTSLTTFRPAAPFGCRVVDKGSTYIHWDWEEPITDGGLPIYEYELSFVAKRMDMNPRTKRYKTTLVVTEAYKTTAFCAASPVCHTGCKVVGLFGGTEHSQWRVRSHNLQGWSDWAEMMDRGPDGDLPITVFTLDVEAPSAPLFFRFLHNTSSCIYLAWDPPFYDGGREVVDYVVHYTVNEVRTTVSDRGVVVPVDLSYHAGANCGAVLRDLPAKTLVVAISVKAVNSSGLISDATKLPEDSIETHQSSRHAHISRELARCANSREQFIDTDFFTGVMQRLLRVDLLRALEEELKTSKPDELEQREAIELAAIREFEAQEKQKAQQEKDEDGQRGDNEDVLDMTTAEVSMFTNRQRRQHFKRRIESLEKKLVDLKSERFTIDTERSRLTTFMKARQEKQVGFQMERDRCKNVKGSLVTSAILMGAPNQYHLVDFLRKLEVAVDDCKSDIAEAKLIVMKNEVRKAKVKQDIESSEVALKERRALFLQFDHEHNKKLKAITGLRDGLDDERVLMKYFGLLLANSEERKQLRHRITHMFIRRKFWQVRNAFTRWDKGEVVESVEMAHVDPGLPISLGGVMLETARNKRIELQGLLRQAMAVTTDIQQKFKLAAMDIGNRRRLTRNKDFKGTAEGMTHIAVEASGMHWLYEADAYVVGGNFTLACTVYEMQIIYLRSRPKLDIKMLAVTHGRMGKMFLRQSKFDRAIVEFGRQLSLAKEVDDRPEMAEAYFGMGSGYLQIRQYDDAVRYLDIAQTRLASLGNMPAYCGAMRDLREVYERVGKPDIAAMYDDKIDRVEGEMRVKIHGGSSRLLELQQRLNNSNADIEHHVSIERSTLRAVQTRIRIDTLTAELDDYETQQEKQQDQCRETEAILEAVQAETTFAFETDETEMVTKLVHDQPQVMNVEEVKNRLADRKVKEVARLATQREELTRLGVQVKNREDSIQELNEVLDLENGTLMKHSRTDLAFRVVALNPGNVSGNEVTGTASGGSEFFVAAEGNNIHLIDYHSGALEYVLAGEPKGAHREGSDKPKVGHEGTVTCLFHDCQMIFSGSTDETIIKWDVATHSLRLVYLGHEGSIVALAAEGSWLCSSSSDATVRLWDKESGQQLRVLYSHSKSVLAMDLGPSWLVTGSADEDVRVWNVHLKGKHTLSVNCKNRLIGHECLVTCVKYGKLEVLSGDCRGRVFIWWMKTGEVLRVIQAHTMAVRCLQFDAVSIVTGSVDMAVVITDIATGEVLQSLRGHEGAILGVAFDSERIVSIGGDNTVRFWQWGKKKTGAEDKYHVLDQGQALLAVTKLYPPLTVPELMLWNGISDPKQMYAGMKLIVKKGDPSVMTFAEQAAHERQMRKEAGMALTSKRIRLGKQEGGVRRYDRVHRQATDMDYHSLGNRMFKQTKSDHELFPDTVNLDANPYSLGQRLVKGKHEPSTVSAQRPRYFMNEDNVSEWGEVSDQLVIAMMSLFVDYEAYEIVLENKRALRSTTSLIGRINAYEHHVESMGSRLLAQQTKYHTKAKRFLMPEERKQRRRAARKEKRRAEREAARAHFGEPEEELYIPDDLSMGSEEDGVEGDGGDDDDDEEGAAAGGAPSPGPVRPSSAGNNSNRSVKLAPLAVPSELGAGRRLQEQGTPG